MFLNSIDRMREVSWSPSYLWDIRFEDVEDTGFPIPEKFKSWFPAASIKDPYADVGSYDFEGYMYSLSIPNSIQKKTIDIQFYDDSEHSLEEWTNAWIKYIFPQGGQYIRPLNSCIKILYIAKVTHDHSIVKLDQVVVYPEGEFIFNGESDNNSPKILNGTFVVVGRVRLV